MALDRGNGSRRMAGSGHRHRRFTPSRFEDLSALSSERGRRHTEISAALPDEMRRIGQTDPEPDAADTDMVEPLLAQHPPRGRHPAIVQQPAEGKTGIV